jgi:hypothetical protein
MDEFGGKKYVLESLQEDIQYSEQRLLYSFDVSPPILVVVYEHSSPNIGDSKLGEKEVVDTL